MTLHLGIRLLASELKQSGHEVCICQLKDFRHVYVSGSSLEDHAGYFLFSDHKFVASGDNNFPITEQELELFTTAIAEWKPDILGFTNRSPYNHLLSKLLPRMRKAAPDAFLVGGSFGPTFDPKISLDLGADAVIRGEGEGTLLELAEALSEGRDWHNIRNMDYLDKDEVVCNPLRPLITDLDAHPFALYFGDHFISIENNCLEYADMRKRSAAGAHIKGYTILAGRGCIANCSYCAAGHWRDQYKEQGLSAPRLRQRSLDNVLEEIRIAKAHGETFITFADEYFVYPVKDLCDFFQKYAEEIALPFHVHMHHRQLLDNPELLESVKHAGYSRLAVGVQSGCEEFAKRIYHRKNNNREILDFIKMGQKNGFSGNYQIIRGNPLEGEKEIEALFDFCSQITFDPSLKTDWYILSAILRLLDGAPLVKEHPELRSAPSTTISSNETIVLAELCNKVDAKTFANIRNNPHFKGHPDRLVSLLHQVIRDLHMQYLVKEIERLKGQEVYFWGCGEMYQLKSPLFGNMKPRCILVDVKESRKEINGIPVFHPSEVLPEGDALPIVVFSNTPNPICRTIELDYPKFTDIVTCARL